MQEVPQADAVEGRGLIGDVRASARRGITFLSQEQWNVVLNELQATLPWHTRRANVLVTGLDLTATVGKRLSIGEVLVEILGETEPCDLMDQQHFGLRAALTPDYRAGVHGRVLSSGTIRIGDAIAEIDAP